MNRAGITSTVAMFPLETARTRLAVNHRQYRNVADCLRSMARNEGMGSWYKVQLCFCVHCMTASPLQHCLVRKPIVAVTVGKYQSPVDWHTSLGGSLELIADYLQCRVWMLALLV